MSASYHLYLEGFFLALIRVSRNTAIRGLLSICAPYSNAFRTTGVSPFANFFTPLPTPAAASAASSAVRCISSEYKPPMAPLESISSYSSFSVNGSLVCPVLPVKCCVSSRVPLKAFLCMTPESIYLAGFVTPEIIHALK